MLLHALRRLARCGFRRVAIEQLRGKGVHQRIASALGLPIGYLLLTALTVAPALAQGSKNNALKEALDESSLVQLLVTVDKAKTVGCDHEFTEVLVANPAIADVIALSNKQVYV